MKYRYLGNSDIEVSEIGFGAWGIGGARGGHDAYGATDDKESINALQCALEEGITLYDTSDLYGLGHSEKIIGKAFKNKREKIIIATKGGIINAKAEQDFTTEYLREALERSLSRLKFDYIDIYQLHSPSIDAFIKDETLLKFCEDIVKEGKARIVGCSARTPQDALYIIEHFGMRVIQINFNMIDLRAIDCGLLKRCNELGVGVIVRTPLCFGFLTGKYDISDVRVKNDHRARWSDKQLSSWINAGCILKNKGIIGNGNTNSQEALRFCLSFEAVSSVIPGMLTSNHVMENIKASSLAALSREKIELIVKINKENKFMDD